MVIERKNKKYNIGDIVYFKEYWSGSIIKSKIKSIFEINRIYDVDCISYVNRDGKDILPQYGSVMMHESNIFKTYMDAFNHIDRELRKTIEKYKSEIKTLNDLLMFPLNNCIGNGENYVDYEAREAYVEKVKEFFPELKI